MSTRILVLGVKDRGQRKTSTKTRNEKGASIELKAVIVVQ